MERGKDDGLSRREAVDGSRDHRDDHVPTLRREGSGDDLGVVARDQGELVGVRCLALTLTVYRVHPDLDRRHVGTGWRVRIDEYVVLELPGIVSPTDVRMETR